MVNSSLKKYIFVLVIYLCVLLVALIISDVRGKQFVDRTLDAELAVVSEKLVYELERYKSLPTVIAKNTVLRDFLDERNSQVNANDKAVNRLLESHAISTESDAIYLLDTQGLTVASSNWQDPGSFLGLIYKFRPYYSEAIEGRPTSYFALGTSSGERGFYFSAPVHDKDKIIGVIVLKVGLSTLEVHKPIAEQFEFVVSNQDGVVFISSHEPWNYMAITELPADVEQVLIEQRQFGLGPIKALTKLNNFNQVLNSSEITLPYNSSEKAFTLKVFTVDDENWRLIVLASNSYKNLYHLPALLLATLIFLVGYFFALYLLGVKRSKQVLLNNQQELEDRVKKRTKQLQETNTDLEAALEKYKQAEASLKQTQNELIQAEKLAVLGEMSAGINHELNQPLTAMRAYAETGIKFFEADKVGPAKENMERILRLSSEMTKIIKKFKVFSRKSTFDTTAICVKQAVDESLQVLSNQINAFNVAVELRYDNDLPLVASDSTLLEQVFVNIIFNAIQALEHTEDAQIQIVIQREKDEVIIRVEDNGPGFSSEAVQQVFTPFYTSKPKGLGLGLTLSRRIIDLFGGELAVANKEPSGAVLSVRLKSFTIKSKGKSDE